ncbi:hypothetical protein VE00_07037 [Pseudogymnoascus sp. WSF 3629]|nr:hypothetical protein VE00_07037 [Pseudogymnoascus sp. WSF 3629]
MSFGYSVGDFVLLVQLANDLRGRFVQAPREYKAITEEVESLIFTLHRIDGLDEKEFDSQQKDGVHKVIKGCQNVLEELSAKLNKLHVMANDSTPDWKGKVRQTWKRLRWDQTEINNFRSRIVSNISMLNLIVGKANQHGIEKLNQRQEDHEREKILSWLSPVSPSARQSEVFNSHQDGTGMWLLKTERFQQWVGGEEQILFCPGIPGAGKTVLSSIIINHLEQVFPNQDEIGIAYLFCNYRQQHTLVELYSALLRQAVQRKPSIPESIRSFYQNYSLKGSRPSEDEVFGELRSVLSSCTRAFVIIDALDECPISDGGHSVRHPFIRQLVRLQDEGFKILATSRPDQEIAAYFEGVTSLEIQASTEDIQHYVDMRLGDLPLFVRKRPNLQHVIKDTITELAKEMFLLARLYFNLLLDQANEKGIQRMLEQFRTGSESNAYDHAYNETMSRIDRQSANASDLAKKTIGWIINAKRTLTVAELENALAVEIETSEFDETNITDIEQLTSYCCGLVIVDEQTSNVTLVHYTTQKYFEGTWKTWFPNIHELITDSCLTYVSYDVFEDRFQTEAEIEGIPREYPFYNYSSHNWGHHFREGPEIRSNALKFLQSQAKISAYDRCGFEPFTGIETREVKTSDIKAEHIAAFFNLEHLMQELLAANPNNVDILDSMNDTPLFLAVIHGHEMLTKMLLDRGANTDIICVDGMSPLHAAASQGHGAIAKLLLDNNADIEIKNGSSETPLDTAASKGHDMVVTLLVDRGANIESESNLRRTPFVTAAKQGHTTTVKLLLSMGANLKGTSEDGEGALHHAAFSSHPAVVELLLELGMSPNVIGKNGETPLHKATRYFLPWQVNNESVVRILLDKGANTEAKNTEGETPLHRAAKRDYEIQSKLLLDSGANIEARRDNDDLTPLCLAALNGSESTVKLLLNRGACIDPKSHKTRTPLDLAAMNGHDMVVTMLLNNSANINGSDRSGYTPLSWAAWSGHEKVLRLLLDRGANPEPLGTGQRQLPLVEAEGGHDGAARASLKQGSNPDVNFLGRTPLHMASAEGHILEASLLIAAGARPDIPDRFGRTPLFAAVCGGHLDMVQFLISLPGVEKCCSDVWGLTPAMVAEKRGMHEIHSLLRETSEAENSNPETWATLPSEDLSNRFCDICLGRFSKEAERYECEYFDICRFCPPAKTNSCPVCGNQLVKSVVLPPTVTEDSCVGM